MKRFLITLLFFCHLAACYSQSHTNPEQKIRLTKKRVQQLFSKKSGVGSPNEPSEWIASYNSDSTYHTADSIRLYSNSYYNFETNSCHLAAWTFYNQKTFSLWETKICQEPPLSTLSTINSELNIRLRKSGRLITLSVYKYKKLRDKFTLISLDRIDVAQYQYIYRLTLIRQRT